ncbi:MAG TPA: fibro-slime domain-containing protein [Polyangiaceae bacterium]|nr:fibro-slime domain-containing protein [Polyangiaceae bacterium]
MRIVYLTAPWILAASALWACSATAPDGGGDGTDTPDGGDSADDGFGDDGFGDDSSTDGSGLGGNGPEEDCDAVLEVTYRDFKGAAETGGHVDFERPGFYGSNDMGCQMVGLTTVDNKPTFASGIGLQKRKFVGGNGYQLFDGCVAWDWSPGADQNVIISADSFSTWYKTTEGVNQEIKASLTLTETAEGSGIFAYDSATTGGFYPIDGQGFGNTPNQAHNYSFTTEAHVRFGYVQGQKFTFTGDDDLWIFVNGKLALDLGGMHEKFQDTLDFDAKASALGIAPGQSYQMDIFHAERHTNDSNFRVETNIKCFAPVPGVN